MKDTMIVRHHNTTKAIWSLLYIIVILLLLQTYIYGFPISKKGCSNKVADIVFLIDSSSSVYKDDFNKQLEFTNNVIDNFHVGSSDIQIGVLTFTHHLHLNFYLNQYNKKDDLQSAVKSIQQVTTPSGSDTGKAINFARTEMFNTENGARNGVSKLLIIITDGESNRPNISIQEAYFAKESGIQIFVIGVRLGPVIPKEFEAIASQPRDQFLYTPALYGALHLIQGNITQELCEVSSTKQAPSINMDDPNPGRISKFCGGKPVDIYFVLDMSSSIWEPHFKQQLDFVSNVIESFDVDHTYTRIGILLYSDSVHQVVPLNNTLTKSQLKDKVRQLVKRNGGTYTGRAIEYLRNTAFSPDNTRQGVAQIAILITDGRSMQPDVTKLEAHLAHKAGIYIFAVGVGNLTNEYDEELTALASEPKENFKFTVDDYDMLFPFRDILAIKACQIGGNSDDILPKDSKINPTCPSLSTDLIFLYDSIGIGWHKSRLVRKTIIKMVKNINMNATNTRIGVISHYNPISADFELKDFSARKPVLKTLRHPPSNGMSKLLRRLQLHSFGSAVGGRKNVQKVAVVFLDKSIHNFDNVSRQLKGATFRFKVIVVGVGKTVQKTTRTCHVGNICRMHRNYHLMYKKSAWLLQSLC